MQIHCGRQLYLSVITTACAAAQEQLCIHSELSADTRLCLCSCPSVLPLKADNTECQHDELIKTASCMDLLHKFHTLCGYLFGAANSHVVLSKHQKSCINTYSPHMAPCKLQVMQGNDKRRQLKEEMLLVGHQHQSCNSSIVLTMSMGHA